MRWSVSLTALAAVFFLGCSSGGSTAFDPLSPSIETPRQVAEVGPGHCLLGLWHGAADPEAGTLNIYPLRVSAMHLNVVPLLEPPAGLRLKISNLKFTDLICDVDVTLVHPFPGLSQYIGFDVAGVFISKGTFAGFSDPDLIMAGPGETRLLNPDGYTRWWNPAEFAIPGQPIFRYRDGLLGNKNSAAHFNCTLNGYKLFGDDLQKDTEVLSLSPSSRVPFKHGSSNTRHYKIDFAGGVVFNYAVDANWELPSGSPPFTPDQYPLEANRPEAWAVSVTELENTLWNDGNGNGGNLRLLVDVWDHQNAGLNVVRAESPGNFDPVVSSTPVGGGNGYSTYEVEVTGATPKQGSIDILLCIESELVGYADVLPGEVVTAYFMHKSSVSGQGQQLPVAVLKATSPTDIEPGDSVSFDASESTGTPPLTFEWDFNGDGVYGGAGDDYTGTAVAPTHKFTKIGNTDVTVKVTNPAGFDISNPVTVHVAYNPLDVFVDADYQGSDSNGTPSKPYKTIQEGMNAVTAGHKVHVDYYDGGNHVYETGSVVLKSNVTLIGDNWNGGGPGKPKADSTTHTWTFGAYFTSVSNFTLEGFEIGFGEVPGNPSHYGVFLYGGSNSNITIRHNKFTDSMDDTGLQGGNSAAIVLSNCNNSLVEFNDVGPMFWHSDTPGEYVRVLLGMDFSSCNTIEVKNNFIHDFTIDYQGDGVSWGQIRMFCLHCYNCYNADVHNNLICHIKGINTYDYRIEGMMMEGYSGGDKYMYYNNTIDNLDHSQSNGGFMLRGIFIYANNAVGSYINNTIITDFKAPGFWSGTTQVYFSSTLPYDISYSTAYNMGSVTNYFHGLTLGPGCTNYPGVDPMYVNNTTPPYDYHFKSGSGCEMGDPNFIDWDDTGSPSGNPNEPNTQNRSRMGCFGGPDGNWDPYDL